MEIAKQTSEFVKLKSWCLSKNTILSKRAALSLSRIYDFGKKFLTL